LNKQNALNMFKKANGYGTLHLAILNLLLNPGKTWSVSNSVAHLQTRLIQARNKPNRQIYLWVNPFP
ncbi:MAG: hypothetical protein O2936_15415, partial [Proteobacteria bacterium]|nr:hypothetical protein [Pseudomonadota bacterium]